MNNQTGIPIIDLLIQHEEAIGSLYKSCAIIFPNFAEFWQEFVIEEKAHADVLRMLAEQLKEEKVFLNDRKFNVTGVTTALEHVSRQQRLVESGTLTILKVLAITMDIERAIIERNFFEVFETDSVLMKREFAALKKHTAAHVERMATMLNLVRQQSNV